MSPLPFIGRYLRSAYPSWGVWPCREDWLAGGEPLGWAYYVRGLKYLGPWRLV